MPLITSKIKLLLLAGFVSMNLAVTALPVTTYAAPDCKEHFLSFPTWYRGLTAADCSIKKPDNIQNFILIVALNLLDILFQAVAYITVAYILWGGFKFITTYGEPSEIAIARQRILNAIIGLVIAMAAVVIVKYIGGKM